MQILKKVLAISREANTSLGSSRKLIMRLAAGCCLVFKTFISFSLSENIATSAPEIVKVSNNNTASRTTNKVIPCGSAARKIKESLLNKKLVIEWLSNERCFSDRLNYKGRSNGLPVYYLKQSYYFKYIPLKRKIF